MAIKTRKISDWLSANGQAITNASAASMKTYLEQNLRSLQDGVYIGKIQKETWGSYMRCEAWQITDIGISKADADAVVVQHGSTRIGIALTEPSDAMKWGSVQNASSVGYQTSSDWSLLDAKLEQPLLWRAVITRTIPLRHTQLLSVITTRNHTRVTLEEM